MVQHLTNTRSVSLSVSNINQHDRPVLDRFELIDFAFILLYGSQAEQALEMHRLVGSQAFYWLSFRRCLHGFSILNLVWLLDQDIRLLLMTRVDGHGRV